MILCPLPFKKWGDMSHRFPPPATPMIVWRHDVIKRQLTEVVMYIQSDASLNNTKGWLLTGLI